MAENVLMIALSPTMESGTISKWDKKEGDEVKSGDVIAEVETDKAAMDYEATQEGTILKILVDEGKEAKVGQPIAIIGAKGEDISALLSKPPGTDGKPKFAPQEMKETAKVEEKAAPTPKEAAEKFQEAKTVEEKKEIAARPLSPLEVAGKKELPSISERAPEAVTPEKPTEPKPAGRIFISPLAARLAGELGVDISKVKGSGPNGRIVKKDVEEASKKAPAQAAPRPAARVTPLLQDREIPVSRVRKIIAERLSQSKFSAPHYYLTVSVMMEEILELRKDLTARTDKKVSFNSIFMKLTAEAIKKYPIINSTWNNDTIIEHGSVDIGLAVAIPDGLITPIVRNCANKSIVEIDDEMAPLIEKARAGKLAPEEFQGNTFTISSLGPYGIEQFTAVINPPASAILAISEIKKVPVVIEDKIEIRQVMKMTLSCDHRVIDGATGAEFVKYLKDIFENPARILY